jgi:glycosyltransferase involved in cell wall biosynthesis
MAWQLASGLVARGHGVRVITTARPPGARSKRADREGGNPTVVYLERTKPGRYSRRWWQASRTAYRFERQHFKPDVVVSISAGAKSVLPLLGSVPAIMQAHGTAWEEVRSKVRTGRFLASISALRNLLWIPQDLAMYRRMARIVAVGPRVYAALQLPYVRAFVPPEKIVLIANGIDTDLFRPHPETKARIRQQLQLPQTAKVLVWASRLHRQKGLHLALEAFATLKTRDIWFVVIGDGPERRNLQQQTKALGMAERVRFIGPVSHDALPEWLNAGDAFVFTSIRHEGLPLNVLEAMSMNLPVVIAEHLAGALQGSAGVYAVDPSDTAAAGETMGRALAPQVAGRSFVYQHYSRDVMLDRYEALVAQWENSSGSAGRAPGGDGTWSNH